MKGELSRTYSASTFSAFGCLICSTTGFLEECGEISNQRKNQHYKCLPNGVLRGAKSSVKWDEWKKTTFLCHREKNSAYGRQRISWPMRIVALIFLCPLVSRKGPPPKGLFNKTNLNKKIQIKIHPPPPALWANLIDYTQI